MCTVLLFIVIVDLMPWVLLFFVTHLCELNAGNLCQGSVLRCGGEGHVVDQSVEHVRGGGGGVAELVHEHGELGGELAHLILDTDLLARELGQ